MSELEVTARAMFSALVRSEAGSDPSQFTLKVLPDGSLRIKGPYAAACYPLDGWAARFTLHLRQGLFTQPTEPPVVAPQPAPVSGGTRP